MVSQAFDGVFAPLARAVGMSAQDVSEAIGNELLALLIEVPSNFVLTKAGRAILNLALGGTFLGVSGFTRIGARTRKDLLELSGHFFNDTVDEVSDPQAMVQFLNELQSLKSGIMSGDGDLISSTFLRTPASIRSWMGQVSAGVQSLARGPSITVTPTATPTGMAVVSEVTETAYRRIR